MEFKPLIEGLNKVVDSVREFNFLVLCLLLLMALDLALYTSKDTGLFQLSYSFIITKITLSDTLIFLASLSLFLAFFVPFIKFIIKSIALYTPTSIRRTLTFGEMEVYPREYYVRLSDFERDAIKENNAIKHRVAQDFQSARAREEKTEVYCLSLILVLIIGLYIAPESADSFVFWINDRLFGEPTGFINNLFQLSLLGLLICCAYIGIYCGCIKSKWGNRYMFFPNYYATEDKNNDPQAG